MKPTNIKGTNAKIYMLEGPQPCTIYCFVLVLLVPQSEVDRYCVLCTVKTKEANKNIHQRTLLDFISIPLYKI